jgi:hypothetical protein
MNTENNGLVDSINEIKQISIIDLGTVLGKDTSYLSIIVANFLHNIDKINETSELLKGLENQENGVDNVKDIITGVDVKGPTLGGKRKKYGGLKRILDDDEINEIEELKNNLNSQKNEKNRKIANQITEIDRKLTEKGINTGVKFDEGFFEKFCSSEMVKYSNDEKKAIIDTIPDCLFAGLDSEKITCSIQELKDYIIEKIKVAASIGAGIIIGVSTLAVFIVLGGIEMTSTFVRVTTQMVAGNITAFTFLITLFSVNLFPMLEKFDDMSERVHTRIITILHKGIKKTYELSNDTMDKVNEKLFGPPSRTERGGKKKIRFSRKKVKKTLKNKNK